MADWAKPAGSAFRRKKLQRFDPDAALAEEIAKRLNIGHAALGAAERWAGPRRAAKRAGTEPQSPKPKREALIAAPQPRGAAKCITPPSVMPPPGRSVGASRSAPTGNFFPGPQTAPLAGWLLYVDPAFDPLPRRVRPRRHDA